jgi:hypothetical protein
MAARRAGFKRIAARTVEQRLKIAGDRRLLAQPCLTKQFVSYLSQALRFTGHCITSTYIAQV